MSRVFWVAVGAVGGIVAYRRGTQAAARARELGPLGTAQVTAQAASRLAGRTAHGLGRLNDLKARREGRLVIGSADEVGADTAAAPEGAWLEADPARPGTGSSGTDAGSPGAAGGSPGTAAGAAAPQTRNGSGPTSGSRRARG